MSEAGRPPAENFDEKLAALLVGKRLLIGLTYEAHDGTFLRRDQVVGRVLVADRIRGIAIAKESDGTDAWFPPDTRGIRAAPPGEYRNRATGEVVVNPDYLASWTIKSSAKKKTK